MPEREHPCKQEANMAVVKTEIAAVKEHVEEIKADVKDLIQCIKGNGAGRGLIARLASLATQQKITWVMLFIIFSGLLGKVTNVW